MSAASDSVTISWEAPGSGGAPTRYKVHLKPTDGGKGKTKNPKARKTSVTFSNLEAGTTYRLWVRAVNKAGKGGRTHAKITLPSSSADTAVYFGGQGAGSRLYFDQNAVTSFYSYLFEYTVGQPQPLSVTLPEATGGTGALTYSVAGRDGVDWQGAGFSFNAATRVLSSNTGAAAPSAAAQLPITYAVTDTGGSQASLTHWIVVHAAPALAAVAQQDLTVGQPASVTLPEATGGSPTLQMRYRLSGTVAGLALDDDGVTLSGTPTEAGTTRLTWTATDLNGATASVAFDVVVVAAGSPPTAAPSSVTVNQYAATSVKLSWNEVQGATGYVLQAKAAGAFPSVVTDSAPHPTVKITHRSGPPYASPHALLSGIAPGNYVARIAAVNGDGPGPWSSEVSFTVEAPKTPARPTAAPQSLTATQSAAKTITLDWDDVSGATDYVVHLVFAGTSFVPHNQNAYGDYYADPGSGANWIRNAWAVPSISRDGSSATLSNVRTGSFKVRVAARNAAGRGPWSSTVTFTVSKTGS